MDQRHSMSTREHDLIVAVINDQSPPTPSFRFCIIFLYCASDAELEVRLKLQAQRCRLHTLKC